MNETVEVIPVLLRSASAALAACLNAAARLASTFVGPIRLPRFLLVAAAVDCFTSAVIFELSLP